MLLICPPPLHGGLLSAVLHGGLVSCRHSAAPMDVENLDEDTAMSQGKPRKTFTLQRNTSLRQCLRNEMKIASVSEVLKTLIQESRRYRELARLDAKITAYYSSYPNMSKSRKLSGTNFQKLSFSR
jgi:hypothetical protein